MKKIVIVEPLAMAPSFLESLAEQVKPKGYSLIFFDQRPLDDSQLIDRIKEAEIIVLSNLPLPEKVLKSAPLLKFIAVAFTGTDHIDIAYCREKGIRVSNASGYSTRSVAELTIGMAIELSRKLSLHHHQMLLDGGVTRIVGTELYNKRFGIFGTGKIGLYTAQLAHAFGCEVLMSSRNPKENLPFPFVSKEDLLKQSDFVSLHIPLTPDTFHFIGEKELSLMKSSSFLINTARGACIDSNALAIALNENVIAGAASDVYDVEPPLETSHVLLKAKNHFSLPHIAFATHEAFINRNHIVKENILNFIAGIESNVVV